MQKHHLFCPVQCHGQDPIEEDCKGGKLAPYLFCSVIAGSVLLFLFPAAEVLCSKAAEAAEHQEPGTSGIVMMTKSHRQWTVRTRAIEMLPK